ncbi:MAG: DNA polymerase III subunit chi [Alphaproteobacteria bacterium]|nr:DNA polymerase III subunit chi [Alphaproteobacteria bacterium]
MAGSPDSGPGAEWWFYHIEHGSLDQAIGPLLEKCLDRRWRVVVAGREETINKLDGTLWTWRDDSFLPHGRGRSAPARQPVLLSTVAEPDNGARVALLLDGLEADAAKFDRCMVVFDGGDAETRAKARKQYKAAADAGAVARYFQQERGGWKEMTPSKPARSDETPEGSGAKN